MCITFAIRRFGNVAFRPHSPMLHNTSIPFKGQQKSTFFRSQIPSVLKTAALAYDFSFKSSSAVTSSSLGLCPILYPYSAHFSIGQRRTSFTCPLLHSRHFARIALIGVNLAMCLPPLLCDVAHTNIPPPSGSGVGAPLEGVVICHLMHHSRKGSRQLHNVQHHT